MQNSNQLVFFYNSQRCDGCKACHVSCKDRSNLPLGVKWRRVYEYVGGSWSTGSNGEFTHSTFAYYMSQGCNHCASPACVKACPTGAMHKRKSDGLVLIDEATCIGCGSCARACPYDAPQFNPEKMVMTKCDGCVDRLAKGQKPTCVECCPQRALDFGTMAEMQEKYGHENKHTAPLPSPEITGPNLIVKPNPLGRDVGSHDGNIINPSEV